MKKMKNIWILLLGLLAMVGCKEDDDKARPATEEQMKAVTGHWYAELPFSGETDNWRTEEEGDKTAFDKIGAVIYLNGYLNETVEDGYGSQWGFLFLHDGEMVNYGGIDLNKKNTYFYFTMDREGHITPSGQIGNMPQVSNLRYVDGVITAEATYEGSTVFVTFRQPEDLMESTLNEYYEILFEEGIVGGYEDLDGEQHTDIDDNSATGPSRSNTTDFVD